MNMIRKAVVSIAIFVLCGSQAIAQFLSFVPGQLLTSGQLNNAFASVLPVAGGTLTGALTAPMINVTTLNAVNPIAVASGGTGSTSASAARSNLGLGTIATQSSSAVALTGGTISNTPISGSTGSFTNASAATFIANGSPNNGPLNVKMASSGQLTTGYTENYSIADDQSGSPWNTPNYFTLRDVYRGTRGVSHGNPTNAGDGNGPVIDFQSWSRRGTYLDAVTLNGGLESAAANNECSDLDINGYYGGDVITMLAIDACGGGMTSAPTLFPFGDISMNLGWSSRRWNNGYFGGTVSMGTLAVSGNAFISGAANVTGSVQSSANISASGTGAMPLYGVTGSAVNGPHAVQGSVSLSSGSATVTLSGSAVFTSATSFTCTANDSTAANAVRVSQTSGASISLSGNGTDSVQFMCVGN